MEVSDRNGVTAVRQLGDERPMKAKADYSSANPLDIKRLACSAVLAQIKAAIDAADEAPILGLPYLTAWFSSDGKGWLEVAGLHDVAKLPPDELARIVFENAPALFRGRKCYMCAHCQGDGRKVCALGNWGRDYAASTVQSSPHQRFKGCDDFERR